MLTHLPHLVVQRIIGHTHTVNKFYVYKRGYFVNYKGNMTKIKISVTGSYLFSAIETCTISESMSVSFSVNSSSF